MGGGYGLVFIYGGSWFSVYGFMIEGLGFSGVASFGYSLQFGLQHLAGWGLRVSSISPRELVPGSWVQASVNLSTPPPREFHMQCGLAFAAS